MTLPVSNYQELLIQVRELTHETIRLQRQLSSDLFDNADPPDVNHNFSLGQKNYENGRHLTDTVIRQCEKNRKDEAGQEPLVEYRGSTAQRSEVFDKRTNAAITKNIKKPSSDVVHVPLQSIHQGANPFPDRPTLKNLSLMKR
ncbi:hypothetical protein K0M31_018823 [Melipona bicolor]|uniref:Uncharacterized protein n=1 Tax=Melipona bicolor TaxID=60889 RepID=A0AA40G544_9HYME|nr:hypothetical protein K0M31_018823 [Melipona bicolor]